MKNVSNEVNTAISAVRNKKVIRQIRSAMINEVKEIIEGKVRNKIRNQTFDSLYTDLQQYTYDKVKGKKYKIK